MSNYTADSFGTNYFCPKHWMYISYLFKIVRSCGGCTRAHGADLYASERNLACVKFDYKWWDLCNRHLEVYNDVVTLAI